MVCLYNEYQYVWDAYFYFKHTGFLYGVHIYIYIYTYIEVTQYLRSVPNVHTTYIYIYIYDRSQCVCHIYLVWTFGTLWRCRVTSIFGVNVWNTLKVLGYFNIWCERLEHFEGAGLLQLMFYFPTQCGLVMPYGSSHGSEAVLLPGSAIK